MKGAILEVGSKLGLSLNLNRYKSTTSEEKRGKMKKFPYKLEYCPNPNVIQIQARSRFPKQGSMDILNLRLGGKDRKRHPLYVALSKISGIESASATGSGYCLQVAKANDLFSWDEILPKILAAIQTALAGKRQMAQVGEAVRPSREYLIGLRLQGCDV